MKQSIIAWGRWIKGRFVEVTQTQDIQPWVLRALEEARAAIKRQLELEIPWKSATVVVEPRRRILFREHMTAEESARSHHDAYMRVVRIKLRLMTEDEKEYDFFCRLVYYAGVWEVQGFELRHQSEVVEAKIPGATFEMRPRLKPSPDESATKGSVPQPQATGPIGVVRSASASKDAQDDGDERAVSQ
jgi:hypothetical protein